MCVCVCVCPSYRGRVTTEPVIAVFLTPSYRGCVTIKPIIAAFLTPSCRRVCRGHVGCVRVPSDQGLTWPPAESQRA